MGYTLEWDCYFPAHPLDSAQVRAILRALWEHGLDFAAGQLPSLTWDDQLRSSAITVLAGAEGAASRSLGAAIDAAATSGYLTLNLWDQDLELTLAFMPQNANPTIKTGLGKVYLAVEGRKAITSNIGPLDSGAVMPAFLEVWEAFVHWSAVLCEVVRPSFGVGFSEGYTLTDEGIHWAGVTHIAEAVQKGQIPHMETWLTQGGIRYLAPELVTPQTMNALLGQPQVRIMGLHGGGLFVVPLLRPFTYEHGIAYRLAARAKAAYDAQPHDPRVPLLYRRARTVLEAVGDEKGALLMLPPDRGMPTLDDIRAALRENGMPLPDD